MDLLRGRVDKVGLVLELSVGVAHILMGLNTDTLQSIDLVALVVQVLHTIQKSFAVSCPQALVLALKRAISDLFLVTCGSYVVFTLEVGASQLLPFLSVLGHLRVVLGLTRIV